ncbi:unnamed protein product [Boreogadus saida]
MSSVSTETSASLSAAGSRVFFQPPTGVGCVGSAVPITRDDSVQRKQGKVTVKYDRKELRKRLVLEEWIIEQLSELYDCEARKGFLWGRDGTGDGDPLLCEQALCARRFHSASRKQLRIKNH